MNILIKQAYLQPLVYFTFNVLAGAQIKGYSHIRQHFSEISLTDNSTAKMLLTISAIWVVISCILLAIGLLIKWKKKILLSSLAISLFDASMISGGLYPMGHSMHSLYGLDIVITLVPFLFSYELKGIIHERRFFTISIFAGLYIFFHIWMMITQLDPQGYHGLTQRLFALIAFGWIAYLAYSVSRTQTSS